MIHLHFNLLLVQFLADHREIWLTRLFLAASYLGSASFYFFFTILLYVVWDKRRAVHLTVLVLLAMSLNDLLKIFIANPRPFIQDGTYLKKWAVSPANAKVLAAEYSTPSGHAMGSSAFYAYFFALVRNRFVRVAFVLAIFLIGASRPYLGVHYVEDVLLGWAIGLLVALTATRFAGPIANLWQKCSHGSQIALTVAACLAFWLLVVALNHGRIDGQVREMTADLGFLTGIVIAFPLELRFIDFDPRSSTAGAKILRYALTIALMVVVLFGLRAAFGPLAGNFSILGCALEYLCYAAVDVAGMFLAPLIFCKLNLAETKRWAHA